MSSTQNICTVSVMDDSDPDIKYDENGVSNHVHYARKRLASECFRGEDGTNRLNRIVEKIKAEGRGKQYDCIIGLSGGVDSTFVAIRCKELGLRPLAVHLDNGWNSEVAVSNIEKTLRALDLDLYTYVIEWEEMKDLQRAMFLSSLTNVEAVTDHAILATLYRQATRHNTRFIISGSNVETEAIHVPGWHHNYIDERILRSVHRRFGKLKKLKSYPYISPVEFLWQTFYRGLRFIPILNYGPYNKAAVIQRLKQEFDWTPYPRKHGESRFTRFFQEYYLPEKFGYDKRKVHFSSLIVAGQMTREEALAELNKPLYRPDERVIDIEYVTKKLQFSRPEWDAIMAAKPVHHLQYPNNTWMYREDNVLRQFVRRVTKSEL